MSKLYWNRVGYISIQGNDGQMHSYGGTDGLDFKFSGEKVGDIYAQFECSILGLSSKTINDLTVWNPAEAIQNSRKIQVFAGYEDGGIENPIFEGIIMEAMPTNPPEMWLNFKCLRFGDVNDLIKEPKMYDGYSVRHIFRMIGEELGFGTIWNAKKVSGNDKSSFAVEGCKKTLVERFSNRFNVTVYEDDGDLIAVDKHPQLDEPDEPRTINTANGLLALGNITVAGATIKTRLDDSSKMFSWVNLESSIIPKANGSYVVIRKKHQGHFRGQEWYTELETIRQGAAV